MELFAPNLGNRLVSLEVLSESHREILTQREIIKAVWDSTPALAGGSGFNEYYDHAINRGHRGELLTFVIFTPESRELVGLTTYDQIDPSHRRLFIRYTWIMPKFRNQSMFNATQHAMIQRALDWGCRRIGWLIEANNHKSAAAIIKLGAKQEGVLREYARFSNGTWRDIALFSLLRDEAKEVLRELNLKIFCE
ncbi:MAG: hypothetical protein CME93_04120 [Hyphomonadaceae bacterium]|nr:hypothetical protein [Hyphomonadaceae bacterium]MAV50132.1 hypothetical protein [Hyphomonadaceae bacterium]OUX94569.1 MAG: hypothetical protein CBB77_05695 [Hyphomonas sp. TMED17]CAI8419947.1 MAG: Uncharacterised protein [Hyphomonas sp. TMED17]